MSQLVLQLLLKSVVPILLCFALFGIFPRAEGWIACGLFVLWRLLGLVGEWKDVSKPHPDWEKRTEELLLSYQDPKPPVLPESTSVEQTGVRNALPETLVQVVLSQVERERSAWTLPRQRSVLLAETVGLLGFMLILPLAVFLYRLDFYSFRRSSSWADAIVFGFALTLYAAPHLRCLRERAWFNPWLWWGLPSVIFLALLFQQLNTRHSYLNPLHPDHRQLAADKILQLTDTVVAADHADWLTNHAADLTRKGASDEAAALCEYALRLRPSMPEALEILRALRGTIPASMPSVPPDAPYSMEDKPPPRAKRTLLDKSLETVTGCTVVLLPMGEVSDDLLDFVAAVITKECGLPVLVYEGRLTLPPHTRWRGLARGRQWSVESLIPPLQQELGGTQPLAPIKYLIITTADIYSDGANFLFNSTRDWGGIVATAQFVQAGGDNATLRHRVAKQSLSTVIKSFGIPPSPDRRCVTSYPASIDELDLKGNRPLPDTRAAFDERINELNASWLHHRATSL